MISSDPHLDIRLAVDEADKLGAQRLRYRVFVEELGGSGTMVDHQHCLERDRFDDFADHLVLVDKRRDPARLDHVVGAYRLMRADAAQRSGGFYSETEFDISPLRQSGKRLLELGRSCVAPQFRGTVAMFMLWNGLAEYVHRHGLELMFGVASFHGTDPEPLKQPLAYLAQEHLAPHKMRARAKGEQRLDMALLAPDEIDRKAALRALPALIRAYLRIGGCVGDGAWVDRAFNTIDVCLILDTSRLAPRYAALYGRPSGKP